MRSWETEIAKLIDWGFSEDPGEWGDMVELLNEGDRIFYHNSTGRNRLAVQLYEYADERIDASIYVLENIGCGYILMPFLWADLEYKWLNCLKMSLDGVGLKGEKLYES